MNLRRFGFTALVLVAAFTVSAQSCSPSGVSMPTGDRSLSGHTWHQVVREDWTKNAPLGSWANNCDADKIIYVGNEGAKWATGPKCWLDTYQHRPYRADAVLSTHDGVLDYWLHTVDGKLAGATPSPILNNATNSRYQTYGIFEARVRFTTSNLSDYHIEWLLWPQDDAVWCRAESDYPHIILEGSGSQVNGFAHYGPATSCPNGATQDFMNGGYFDPTAWHTYTQEWGPGYRKYYLDGTQIGQTSGVGGTGHYVYGAGAGEIERWQLTAETNSQCDQNGNASCTQDGHMLIDWAVAYSY